MSSDFRSPKQSHPSPVKLAYAVFRTTPDRYKAMVNFLQALNANIRYEDPGKITFLSSKKEPHRIVIVAVLGLSSLPPTMHHERAWTISPLPIKA